MTSDEGPEPYPGTIIYFADETSTHMVSKVVIRLEIQDVPPGFTKLRNGIRIRKENETDVKPEITVIMEIVNIEARTFEAMLSAFRTFADRLDTLCRLYGDMEEKKWLDNQEVCLLLKVSPRTLQTLRDNGTLAYTQICHKTYYKPGDVESIIRIVEERRKRAESMGRSI